VLVGDLDELVDVPNPLHHWLGSLAADPIISGR
jgi:hypothetical protein